MMPSCKVIVTFESVDEILKYDHLNETYLAELSHGTTVFFSVLQYETWKFCFS